MHNMNLELLLKIPLYIEKTMFQISHFHGRHLRGITTTQFAKIHN